MRDLRRVFRPVFGMLWSWDAIPRYPLVATGLGDGCLLVEVGVVAFDWLCGSKKKAFHVQVCVKWGVDVGKTLSDLRRIDMSLFCHDVTCNTDRRGRRRNVATL